MDKSGLVYKETQIMGSVGSTSTSYVTGCTTTDAVAGVINAISIPSGSTGSFKITVTAVQTGGIAGTPGDSAGFIGLQGLIKNVAGTTSVVNSTATPAAPTYNDAAAAAWRVAYIADNTADTLKVSITGEVNKTIDWTCKIEVQLVS